MKTVSVVKKAQVCQHCATYSQVAKKVNKLHTCPECAVSIFKKHNQA